MRWRDVVAKAMAAALLASASSLGVPGFENAALKQVPQVPPEVVWSHSWSSADWATAASALVRAGLLDRAVLYLHVSATFNESHREESESRWLAFGRSLVALASADPPFPMARDGDLLQQLASAALASATRVFGGRCEPSGKLRRLELTSVSPHRELLALRQSELRACQASKNLARDVLAQLIVHCDNADGSLWDRCPEEYLARLRTAELPPWPQAPSSSMTDGIVDSDAVPCDIARRQWPQLTAEAFEREYNAPQVPVIVGGLTHTWPASRWADDEGSDDWLFLRMGQSVVRSLMRRAHGEAPYPTDAARPNPAMFFGVGPFAHGAQLANQYINLDAPGSAYRHPLLAGYETPPLIQTSLLETRQCFPDKVWTVACPVRILDRMESNPSADLVTAEARATPFTHYEPRARVHDCMCMRAPWQLDVTDARKQANAGYIHSRWVLVSAAGSGSEWHVDPWNTSAWNALLHGRKRWALYPPRVDGLPPRVASASPSDFFGTVLPELPPSERPLQCVLEAGEVMFLPSGWWHTVLNLQQTIAVTENRVDDANVAAVLEEMRSGDYLSAAGRRATERCRREAARPTPFERGKYPRNCEERLKTLADGEDMYAEREREGLRAHLECVRKMSVDMEDTTSDSEQRLSPELQEQEEQCGSSL